MEVSNKTAKNQFELSTYQRRLRHLRCLALRNLWWPGQKVKDLTNLQAYFTLHVDQKSPAFYTSETIQGSLNPTWQSFDISRYDDKISTRTRFVVLKIWVGVKNKFEMLIDWDVNLMGLVFFADKLQQDTVKYATNSLIFGMFDKYFVAPEANKLQKAEIEWNEITVDSSSVRNSYRTSSVTRIYTVLRATKQTQATVNKFHRCIEDKLLSSQEKAHKLSTREALIMKGTQLRSEMTWQSSRLQLAKDELDKMKSVNQQREEEINERFLQLKKNREELLDSKKSYNQTRENFIKEEAQWKIRRKQLIGELATYIYPITENKKKEYFICNVMLPDSESFQGSDDTQIAVALGYTSHMVSMMSHILDFPLRYSIEHRSSRSQITDHIHHKLTEKDNTFPLYSKGKEKFYFNYGVYLLNKDIGQLRFYCGMGTADLRTTLQNIKTLLELRLGTKLENQSRLSKPFSDNKDKNYIDIDTHSSLASGGRLSVPDSTDMAAFENILSEAKLKNRRDYDSLSNITSIDSTQRKHSENGDSEDISFHPSPDDNFFKISNPVSDKSDILYDVDAIEQSLKVTELVDFSDNASNKHDSTDFFEYKLRTDSDLTTSSSSELGPKGIILESQMSTLSTTDYHQKHSTFNRHLSVEVSEPHSYDHSSFEKPFQNNVRGTSGYIEELSDDLSIEKYGNLEFEVKQTEKCENTKYQTNECKVPSETSEVDQSFDDLMQNYDSEHMNTEDSDADLGVHKETGGAFPEIQRTFKTLSLTQPSSKTNEHVDFDDM